MTHNANGSERGWPDDAANVPTDAALRALGAAVEILAGPLRRVTLDIETLRHALVAQPWEHLDASLCWERLAADWAALCQDLASRENAMLLSGGIAWGDVLESIDRAIASAAARAEDWVPAREEPLPEALAGWDREASTKARESHGPNA